MTNRELAKQLGISPAAFSLIINNKPGISEQTRQRVLANLEEMGLSHLVKPAADPATAENESPSEPTTSSPVPVPAGNGSICFAIYKKNGVVVGYHPFFLLLMESIENRAKTYGLSVMLRTIDSSADMKEQIQQLNLSGVRGALIMATEMLEEDLNYFSGLTIPYVFIDNDFTFLNINSVSINNQMGTYQAVEYLAQLGHRNIGYVRSSNRISSWDERTYGFHHAAELLGVDLSSEHIYTVRYDEESSYRDMKEILETQPSLPSALVFEDDVVAAGVCRALKESGYRIPEDISLVGFNNRPICETIQPNLTSIDVPKYSFGTAGVDLLYTVLSNRQEMDGSSAKYRIGTRLVIRDSAGPCRK